LDGHRLPLRHQPPSIGEHSRQVLLDLGYSHTDIHALIEQGVVRTFEE
jgi:crotonobetainyl-CoA:carnitine CoA-transferase CaiB-like acyl-CoA transferase